MSDTMRMELRLSVTVDVPKSWAGPLLLYVRGGVEPEPPVKIRPVRMTGPDGRTVESGDAPIVLSSRAVPDP